MSGDKNYKKFMLGLAQDLSSEDCNGLSFLADLPSSPFPQCCCMTHGRAGAIGVLERMQDKALFSPADLNPLASLLKEVGRFDLASRCDQLLVTTPPPSPSPPLGIDRRSSVQELDHINRDATPTGANATPPTSNTHQPLQGQSHAHFQTTPTAHRGSRFQLPLRCSNPLSLSTSSLARLRKSKHSHSGRQRGHIPATQSFDEGASPMATTLTEGYIMVEYSGGTDSVADRPHLLSSTSTESEGLSPDELEPRVRSQTLPEPVCLNSPLSPTRSLPPSSPAHFASSHAHLTSSSTHYASNSTPNPAHLASEFSSGSALTLTWILKRMDLVEPVFKHSPKTFDKCFKLRTGGRGQGRLTLGLKLYPNGVNWALDQCASLQIGVNSRAANTTLYLKVTVREKGLPHVLAHRKKVCKLAEQREFLIEEFLSHDVLKSSKAKHIQVQLKVELGYSLGEDWVCIGSESKLGCLL